LRISLSPASRRAAWSITAAAALAASGMWVAAPAGAQASAPQHTSVARSCATPKAGMMACNALKVTSGAVHAQTAAAAPSGYGPADLKSAYALPSGGSGQTVAIVDAFDDPNAESDLATYRSTFGLPACTTANGCFKKVGQSGSTTSLPAADAGWAEEESLDIDMVSAVCPNCHILLVEATSPTTANLGTSVNRAVTMGAKFVSNSYGGGESSSDTSFDSMYFNHPGVAVTASSGDAGFGVEYPAASRFVTAVGGTSLRKASTSRGWSETAWSGAGSGCSAVDAKPAAQKDTGCSRRTVADVSAVADPATGVAVYDTFGDPGWEVFGGTSVSSPIIASVFALAGAPSSGSTPSSFPYAHTGSLNDVTSGSNGSCSPTYLCSARTGYDGPTGLGTPNGTAAFHS
jgi:subtilase family serine protease